MSVTFFNPANPAQYDEEYNFIGGGDEINVSNSNACDILEFLGLGATPGTDPYDALCGSILAKDLEVLCRRKLMALSVKALDQGLPTRVEGNVIHCGRAEGYLTEKVIALLSLAKGRKSEEDMISWS